MTTPGLRRQDHNEDCNLTNKRSDFDQNDGNFSTWAIDFGLILFLLHRLEEHRIGIVFLAIGDLFGVIVREDLVRNTFSGNHISMGEANKNQQHRDAASCEGKDYLENAI
jgi:hypothetical protein